jgi:hypothetical protein
MAPFTTPLAQEDLPPMSDQASLAASPRLGVDAVPPDVGTGSAVPAALRIVPWRDPVIDTLGHDPRSWYVEQFWLPIVGPTATWLMRRMVAGLDVSSDGYAMDLDDTARGLGLGGREGRHSPFQRALARCVSFHLARPQGRDALGVRRRLPPLTRRHLERLPATLQKVHAEWMEAQGRPGTLADARNRARRLALTLLDIGADGATIELQLMRWHVHPALAHEATRWALALPVVPSFSGTAKA